MTDLGTLGGVVSRATDLNDLGQVVGTAEAAMGIRYAFIWHEGVMTDLNDPERLLPPSSTALSINNSGQIVGFFVDTGGGRQAVLWNAGEVTELGTLGGRESEAVDINESGQVVGWAHTAAGGPRAFLWADGKMIELGTLRGRTSYASAINNAGVVVGRAAEAGGYPTRAFVHDSANGMRDLNDLTTLGSGWILYRAFDINDAGQILVSARCGCRSEAFVLTPTTADLGGQWANDLSACPHRTCGHLTARPPTPGTGPCGIGTVGLAPLMVICVGTMRSSEVRRQT